MMGSIKRLGLSRLRRPSAPDKAKPERNPVSRRSSSAGHRGDPPLRLMIGTCPGSRRDTEALVRAQVERYFDSPESAWFTLQKASTGGYHYEIHEGGDGFGYLSDALAHLIKQPEATATLSSAGPRQIRVRLKPDGGLISTWLSESESGDRSTEGVYRAQSMTPIAKTGAEWVKLSATIFSLGLLAFASVTTIHKSMTLSAQGYYEFVDQFAPARLVELLSGGSEHPMPVHVANRPSPLDSWSELVDAAGQPDRYIERFVFENGAWRVEMTPRQFHRQSAPAGATADDRLAELTQDLGLGPSDISTPSHFLAFLSELNTRAADLDSVDRTGFVYSLGVSIAPSSEDSARLGFLIEDWDTLSVSDQHELLEEMLVDPSAIGEELRFSPNGWTFLYIAQGLDIVSVPADDEFLERAIESFEFPENADEGDRP